MLNNFADYAYYYNLIYEDKDYMKEANDVISILHEGGEGCKFDIRYGMWYRKT